MKRLFLVSLMFMAVQLNAALPRLAIMKLDNKTSGDWHYATSLGDGFADMLVTSFMDTKKYKVLERNEMQKILDEQHFSNTEAVTPETAIKLGKLLGVQYMVFGSVNEFGTAESGVGAFGVGIKSHKATVGLDIRVVDTTTGEIVSAATGLSSKTEKGVHIDNAEILPTNINFGSSHFNTTLVGKASRAAVDDAVSKVIKNFGGAWTGAVIKVGDDGLVMVNGGKNVNISIGDVFKVVRKGEEIKDPQTGEILGSDDKELGELQIVQVNEKYSSAKIVKGGGFAAKDMVIKK